MNRTDTFLQSANIIVSTIGVVTAESVVPGSSAFLGGALSINSLFGSARPNTDDLDKRVGKMLTQSLDQSQTHLPREADKIIPQMIAAGALSPADVMAAGRDPKKMCSAMLEKMQDPEHRRTDMQQAFSRVIVPIFTTLLNDNEVCDLLRPAFENALAGSLAHIQQNLEQLLKRSDEPARKLGIQEGMLIAVARRYAVNNPTDFDGALAGVEHALETAAAEREAGRLPSNLPEAVEAVMARVDALNNEGLIDEGQAALLAALGEQRDVIAEAEAGQLRLVAKGLAQAVMTRDVKLAVSLELEKLRLDGDDGFEALRDVEDFWYERGRDKGLRFDLQVSIGLAEASGKRAVDSGQRGIAANDLGSALWTLGKRESGTAQLQAAVAAYENALLERTRDKVPLDWAMTQNNLGNALRALGERESGTAQLLAAVAAFENALLEWTRDKVPLDWATTQNNLALVEEKLGGKAQGEAREMHLRRALGYVAAALEVFDPKASGFYYEKASRTQVRLQAALDEGYRGAAG